MHGDLVRVPGARRRVLRGSIVRTRWGRIAEAMERVAAASKKLEELVDFADWGDHPEVGIAFTNMIGALASLDQARAAEQEGSH